MPALWIESVLEFIQDSLLVLVAGLALSLIVVYAIRLSSRSNGPLRNVGKQLYLALWNPIIDYSFKIFSTLKNIYYFPLGVDHRIFRHKYSRVANDNGRATVVEETNLHPVAPKANYHLLCLTVWAVTAYIYWAVKSIIASLYGPSLHDPFVRSLPAIVAGATFLLDVWIVRSYEFTSKSATIFNRVTVFLLRITASLCTAALAAFHIFSIAFEDDIASTTQQRALAKVARLPEYQRLASWRDLLAEAEYRSDGIRYCLDTLSRGRKSTDPAVAYSADRFAAVYQRYQLPPEAQGIGPQRPRPVVAPVDCARIALDNEPVCRVAWADKATCPRFASRTKAAFEEYAGTFGVQEALKKTWFDVTRSYPELLKLDEARGRRTLKASYDDLYGRLFPEGFDKNLRSDISIAVESIENGINRLARFGIFLLLAPVVIVALFEFSVLIVKTIWGHSQADSYLSKVDDATGETLISDQIKPLQKSYLLLSSDFHIQDHVANILEVFSKALQPLMESRLFSAILLFVLFVGVFRLATSELGAFMAPLLSFVSKAINALFELLLGELPLHSK